MTLNVKQVKNARWHARGLPRRDFGEKARVVLVQDDDIIRVDFGEKGREYFKQQFSYGNKLATLMECCNPDIVEAFSFLPRSFSQVALEAENYKWGLGMSLEDSPTRPPLVKFIHEYLDASPKNLCVMEHADPHKDDPCVRKNDKSRIFFYESGLYHMCVPGNSPEQIDYDLLVAGSPRWFMAILTTPNDFFTDHQKSFVDFHHLSELAQNAKYLIAAAWDEEGYMIGRLGEN